jgi:NitT/TauT family transport system substrate-binding protein
LRDKIARRIGDGSYTLAPLMKTQVEEIGKNRYRVSVEVPHGDIARYRDRTYRKLAKEVRVPGFRPGKAPAPVIEQRLGRDFVRGEVLREALPDLYAEALEGSDLDVVAPPEIDVKRFEDGEDLVFEAVVETRPAPELKEYTGLEVARPASEVSDEDVDEQIEHLRMRFASLEVAERPLRSGDFALIDLTTYRHDETIEELTAKDFLVEVGAEMVVPELDAELEDMVTLIEQGDESLLMMHNVLNRVTLTLVMRSELADELGVSRDSPLDERLQALEGLTLGITSPGATSDDFMQYYLRRVGLEPDRDAEIVAMGGGPSLLAALETGQIDAYHLSPPTPFIAEAEGFGTILVNGPEGDVPEFADFVYTAWATNRGWAEENPEATMAFSRAIARGVERSHEDPEAAAEIAAEFLGAEFDETLASLEAMLPAMPESGCLSEEEMGESLATLFEAEISDVEGDPSEGAYWTNEYAEGC